MSWLTRTLDHAGRERIEAALRAADRRTCGEIVPVLARRSARHGHAPWLAGALCLALAAGAAGSGVWGPWWSGPVGSCALALACAALGWALSRFGPVRRALTPPRDRVEAVHRAAEAAFHRLGLHRARGDAGILLYVSLEERRAVVLAGAGISDLAGAEHWEKTCGLLTAAAARRDLAAGFERAIVQAADVLAAYHPAPEKGPEAVLAQRLRILHEPL